MGDRRRSPVRWIERGLLAIGIACLAWYGFASAQARSFQAEQKAMLERMLEKPAPDVASGCETPVVGSGENPLVGSFDDPLVGSAFRRICESPSEAGPHVRPGALIGSLEIPRLGMSMVVIEGDDDAALNLAVGHLPDTPRPGQNGNSALAAHRDTFFRPLKDIRAGDALRLTTVEGDFHYRVSDTWIVDPDDVWVLEPTPGQTLTLVTCYPFTYIGHAPRRFIVRAERIDEPMSP